MRAAARTKRTSYAVEGNTARKLSAVPDYDAYKRQRQEQIRRELEAQRVEEEQRARQEKAIRRNQMRALSFGRGYVTFLTIAGVITAVISAGYIKLQSDLTAHLKNISKLESQLEDVRADNSAAAKCLNTAADLRYVKQVAIADLGMHYAGSDQVVYYTVDNADYMNQYADIPD